MFKKCLSALLVVALTAGIAITGTIAYLTDKDSKVNSFTIGNVSIELEEEFTPNSALLPGVKVKKEAKIENTGTTDAWVWMTMAIPSALDTVGNASENALHWNVPGAFWDKYYDQQKYVDSAIEMGYLSQGAKVGDVQIENTWNVDDKVEVQKNVAINGKSYNVYTFLYNGKLASNAVTNIALNQVYLDPRVDIDAATGNWSFVKDGVSTPLAWNSNTDGAPSIIVEAFAIQDEGFDSAKAAYDAYQAQWTP